MDIKIWIRKRYTGGRVAPQSLTATYANDRRFVAAAIRSGKSGQLGNRSLIADLRCTLQQTGQPPALREKQCVERKTPANPCARLRDRNDFAGGKNDCSDAEWGQSGIAIELELRQLARG
jgi:hypothetical protein